MTRRELSRRLTRLEMEATAPTPTKSFWEWLCGRAAVEELDDRGRALVAETGGAAAYARPDRTDPFEERIAAVGRHAVLDATARPDAARPDPSAHPDAPPFRPSKELRDEHC